MSQVKEFVKKLADASFSKQLQQAYIAATVNFAAEHGYSFTESEYINAISSQEPEPSELNDDELKKITGGAIEPSLGQWTTDAVGEEGGGLGDLGHF